MDIVIKAEDVSLSQVALYASISFLIVSLLGAILYVTCSKKYRLNWFEKNLLEAATDAEQMSDSREALMGGAIACSVDNVSECQRSIGRGSISPTSLNTEDPTFWVPSKPIFQQTNNQISCADESPPMTPTSPTGSSKSLAISIGSGSVQMGKSDKFPLTSNSTRPKVSSMHVKLDHTKIDTALYRTNSLASSSGASNVEDLRGTIHLSILFDPIAGILTIRLIEAQDLQPRDFSGTADPYAKVRLLPDKKNVWQTRIHKKTLNPVFDEDFVFEEHPAVIAKRTIEILLYDFDAYSRHVCIGGTQIELGSLDLSQKIELRNPLGGCSEQDAKIDLGDIMVSLAFLPSAERLTVIVIKARNLKVVDDTRNSSDPYVKVSLIHGGKKIKKKKTTVIRSNINPVFNEALTFDVSKETLKNSFIEFVALHDSLLGSNEVLGRALVGNSRDIRPEEKIFFDEMFRTKSATAQWIPLQDDLSANTRPRQQHQQSEAGQSTKIN